MAMDVHRMADEEFAAFSKKYPNVQRSDIEDVVSAKVFAAMAQRTRQSEVEALRSKALDAMGTDHEMSFYDVESGMLNACLADGRQALKDIMEKIPVEAPLCSDGTKMKDHGRKKKT